MQLEHLKCIMELNEQGNYADAAQSLYLGQNSLRDIVKNMEAELGFTIFSKNNSPRRVRRLCSSWGTFYATAAK